MGPETMLLSTKELQHCCDEYTDPLKVVWLQDMAEEDVFTPDWQCLIFF